MPIFYCSIKAFVNGKNVFEFIRYDVDYVIVLERVAVLHDQKKIKGKVNLNL